MTLPIARTEPSCFSDVDGFPMPQRGAHAAQGDGSAKIGVGDGAASCELKAPIVSSGARHVRNVVVGSGGGE
jgi:hypothetical protein